MLLRPVFVTKNEKYTSSLDYSSTCSMLKSDEPETPSGYYMIQPKENEPPS